MSTKLLPAVCAVVAISIAGIVASPADAAPTLTLSTAPDPTESITTQLLVSGYSSNPHTTLNATIKSTGGAGCAANAAADGGRELLSGSSVGEGPFSRSINETFSIAGSYLLCAWLTDYSQSGYPVLATASLAFSVRPPHLALSISAPTTVLPGQIFQLVTTAQTEVTRTLTEYVLPNTGRGCPANSSAAGSTSGETAVQWPAHGSEWSVNGGPFSEGVNETLRSTGQYLVCAYIQYPTSSSPPEATASAMITVDVPRPHCVVPHIRAGSTLAAAERRIRASHCAVGRILRAHSRRYRRGHVLRLGARSGQVLPFGSPIAILVSNGRSRR